MGVQDPLYTNKEAKITVVCQPEGAFCHDFLRLQVIMLLLGGFAIAAALSKHYIAKAMATWVLLKVPPPLLELAQYIHS